MFGFIKPVKLLLLIACVYLAGYVVTEVLFVRQTAEAVKGLWERIKLWLLYRFVPEDLL